jgi:hypothetical protein
MTEHYAEIKELVIAYMTHCHIHLLTVVNNQWLLLVFYTQSGYQFRCLNRVSLIFGRRTILGQQDFFGTAEAAEREGRQCIADLA